MMLGTKRMDLMTGFKWGWFIFILVCVSCKTKERTSALDYREENPSSMTAADLQQATKQGCLLRGRVWDEKTQTCVTPQVACKDVPGSVFDFTKNICLAPRDLCLAEDASNEWFDGKCLSSQEACEKEKDGSIWVRGSCVRSKEACDLLGYHWKWEKNKNLCLMKGFLEHCADNKAPDATKKTTSFLRGLQKNMPMMSCQETFDFLKQMKSLQIDPPQDGSIFLEDLYPLSDIAGLESVIVEAHPIEDLLPLAKMPDLKKLVIKKGKISDVNALSDAKKLTYLDLSDNQIKTLKGTKNLMNLEALMIENNQVEDLLPIKDLVNLTILSLDNNPLKSLSFLRELKKITSISASGTPIGTTLPKTPVNCPRGPDVSVAIDRFCAQLQY